MARTRRVAAGSWLVAALCFGVPLGAVSVPEPGSVALLGGLALAAGRRWRTRAA